MNQKKQVEVVAAVIVVDGEILCVQRGASKLPYIHHKWEFPGGKLEEGETHEEALKREIQEELHYDISVDDHLMTIEHDYPDFHLTMHTYGCTAENRELTLTEHIAQAWRPACDLAEFDWAAADLPIVDELSKEKRAISAEPLQG